MNKNTKREKENPLKTTLSYFLLCIIMTTFFMLMGSIYFRPFIKINQTSTFLEAFVALFGAFKYVYLLIIAIFLFLFVRSLIGIVKGKTRIAQEEVNPENPYIYYRDLPNDYGIGVNTLLLDSTIENEKDIIAAVLDLAAKKYLTIIKFGDTYKINILKQPDGELLKNENFILESIIKGNLKEFDYSKWYDLCLEDGIEFGLYKPQNLSIKKFFRLSTVDDEWLEPVLWLYFIIVLVAGLIMKSLNLSIEQTAKYDSIFLHIAGGMLGFIILIYLLQIIINSIKNFRTVGKLTQIENYVHTLNNRLTRTNLGQEELMKLSAFKSFIHDFGDFANKSPEEIVLWDRYLSYAQLFGLTKEIMKSGYVALVTNSSFDIDDIDNITLNKMVIETKIQ